MTDVRGILPPIPTYLREDGGLDVEAQQRGVRHPLAGGADGVLVLGTSGEGPVLTPEVRWEAMRVSVLAAQGATVVVGCGGHTLGQTLAQLQVIADAGASAALVLPPHYYRLGQAALERYYVQLASASPVDLLLYHIPALAGNGFTVPTVSRLAAHPRIVGIKDSTLDLPYHLELLRHRHEHFAVFQGTAPLAFASAAAGSEDGICAVTALLPSWEVEMRRLLTEGRIGEAAAKGDLIARCAALLNLGDVPQPVNLKTVASLLGLGTARPHEPTFAPNDDHREQLRSGLLSLGISLPSDGGAR